MMKKMAFVFVLMVVAAITFGCPKQKTEVTAEPTPKVEAVQPEKEEREPEFFVLQAKDFDPQECVYDLVTGMGKPGDKIKIIFAENTEMQSPILKEPLTDRDFWWLSGTVMDYYETHYLRDENYIPQDPDTAHKTDPAVIADRFYGLDFTFYEAGRTYVQWVIYSGDEHVAGKSAYWANENIPKAKYIVRAWRKLFEHMEKDFRYDYELEGKTSVTYEIFKGFELYFVRDYEQEKVRFKPVRDEHGILVNPRLPFRTPEYGCSSESVRESSMKFADSEVEENMTWYNRAAFWAGPQVVEKLMEVTLEIEDILWNHPERMVPIKIEKPKKVMPDE